MVTNAKEILTEEEFKIFDFRYNSDMTQKNNISDTAKKFKMNFEQIKNICENSKEKLGV